jgi:hypothetical protein
MNTVFSRAVTEAYILKATSGVVQSSTYFTYDTATAIDKLRLCPVVRYQDYSVAWPSTFNFTSMLVMGVIVGWLKQYNHAYGKYKITTKYVSVFLCSRHYYKRVCNFFFSTKTKKTHIIRKMQLLKKRLVCNFAPKPKYKLNLGHIVDQNKIKQKPTQ